MSTNTGGPAFPGIEIVEYGSGPRAEHHIGMTLRDYFAAKAMQGIAASPVFVEWSSIEIARCAYVQADAMIDARGAA